MTAVSLPTTLRTSAPRLAQPIGQLIASLVARVQRALQPHQDSPAEAAARLRQLANQFASQPSFAADLRAAADRHEEQYGIQ